MSELRSSPEQILCFVIAWYLLFLPRKKAETRLLSPHFWCVMCQQTAVFRNKGVIIPCQDPEGSTVPTGGKWAGGVHLWHCLGEGVCDTKGCHGERQEEGWQNRRVPGLLCHLCNTQHLAGSQI